MTTSVWSSSALKIPPKSHRLTPLEEANKLHKSIAEELTQVTLDYYTAVNDRCWSKAAKLSPYYHPSYRSECRFSTHKQTFEDSIEVMRQLAKDYPGFKVNVVDSSVEIDAQKRTATVFCRADWIDAPPGLLTQVVRVIEWKFVDGMWLCMKSELLRGVDEVV